VLLVSSPMRRRPGLAGLKAQKARQAKLQTVGRKIEEDNMEHMQKQLSVFRENLEAFAAKHKDKINKNPAFRQKFQILCARTGVDPLASRQGFWAQMLGLGDFYYELAVQLIQLCLALREENGGLISLNDLHKELSRRRGRHQQEASIQDVEQAIEKVQCLGSGFRITQMGGEAMVISVPTELNTDHAAILSLAKSHGQGSGGGYFVTIKMAMAKLKWHRQRIITCLEPMVQDSMVWLCDQEGAGEEEGRQYWFACLAIS